MTEHYFSQDMEGHRTQTHHTFPATWASLFVYDEKELIFKHRFEAHLFACAHRR